MQKRFVRPSIFEDQSSQAYRERVKDVPALHESTRQNLDLVFHNLGGVEELDENLASTVWWSFADVDILS